MSDLIHDPAQFESRSWIVIGAGYKPTVAELMESPRSRLEHTTTPLVVAVVRRGRTGDRFEIHPSLTQAVIKHGRWVRTSLESEKIKKQGAALEVWAEKREVVMDKKQQLVKFSTGQWVRYEGGNLTPTPDMAQAWPFKPEEAEIVARQIGGAVFTLKGNPVVVAD